MEACDLHSYLVLDHGTGKLFWKPRKGLPKTKWGQEAFTSTRTDGYKQGCINQRKFLGHRVVYALAFGQWPQGCIDHINGDKSDNRPENLRDVSHAENHRNMPKPANNTSGHVGVTWQRKLKKWGAQIKIEQRVKWLGTYASLSDAIAARKSAENEFGFHENHGEQRA